MMGPLLVTRSSKNEADDTTCGRCCCGTITPSRQLVCCLLLRGLLGTDCARCGVGRLIDAIVADRMVDCIASTVRGFAADDV